jgi:hypothetical protein
LIRYLNLDEDHLRRMFDEIYEKIDDPVQMDAFYLEMRHSNDPST